MKVISWNLLRLTGARQFTETVPVLDDQGHMTPMDVERELQVDVALQWSTGYDTVTRSFVNVIATPKGGTHVTGFERALVRSLNTQLRAARLLEPLGPGHHEVQGGQQRVVPGEDLEPRGVLHKHKAALDPV